MEQIANSKGKGGVKVKIKAKRLKESNKIKVQGKY